MSAPESAYSDGTHLFVADTGNHRVLVWNTFPTESGQPADVVLGQVSADQVLGNRGLGRAGPDTMSSPTSIDVALGALFVADSGNNRVLYFATIPASSGAAADAALGQPDLTSRGSTSQPDDKARLAGPVALANDGANLYVADRDLGRVIVYALPTASTGAAATTILGSTGGLSAAGPAGLAVERTPFFTSRVYLADTNNDRLVILGSVSRLLSSQ
jgi:hypothetical protein